MNETVPLKSVATIIMGTSPPSTTYNKNGEGLPLLNGPTEFSEISPNCTLFTTDSIKECQKDDLLFCVRASTGRMNWADRVYSIGRGICAIRGKNSEETKYIRYCLETYLDNLLQRATGATFSNLKKGTILNFEIPWPSYRNKIVNTISPLDNLIKVNIRRIQVLEELARSLYDEWFVRLRFPGHEDTEVAQTEHGPTPKGWAYKPLGKVTENYDRKRIPLSKMERSKRRGSFPYYGAAKILDYIDDYIFDGRYLLIGEDGSVVTPNGYPVLQLVDEKFWVNNHTHVIQAKFPLSTNYLYLYLRNFPILGYVTGAAQPKINQTNMNRIPVLVPSAEIMGTFNDYVKNVFNLITNYERINDVLFKQRDLLLRKLISGEIDISDIDITV